VCFDKGFYTRQAWKHSKKDFLVLIVTFVIVFVFDTGMGLAVGIGLSLAVVLCETLFSKLHAPIQRRANDVSSTSKNIGYSEAKEVNFSDETSSDARIELIELRSDVNFVTVRRLNDMVFRLINTREESPIDANSSINERIVYTIAKTVDTVLVVPGKTFEGVDELPDAIVVDFNLVRFIDLTAMIRIDEMCAAVRSESF